MILDARCRIGKDATITVFMVHLLLTLVAEVRRSQRFFLAGRCVIREIALQ